MEKFNLPSIDLIKTAIVSKIRGIAWRVVESQEEIATLELVDTLEEQAILEGLLEKSKPPLPENCRDLDYLLATPFRYPPLKWGSRFGRKHEPSLFYGSENIPTALAETAYYRVLFWTGMAEPPPSGTLKTQHTIYSTKYDCSAGLYLNKPPFEEYQDLLQHPQDYSGSQKLGTIMRELGVDGFQFISARCPNKGLNIALFTPYALAAKRPDEKQNWICETSEQHIMFSGQGVLFKFNVEGFQIDGKAPLPAS
ncbi:RES family NAD+ phosphorylase [Paremcibacter congregatus]|uniref:RES family NAD+ phosphorylase n=1 Tax=Paremcibacter congregatus TaxID=2043170 RepID=UPI001958D1E1|nr:RES family NAD+ phosphorylase [Paremcibacter congregatus]